MAGGRELVVEGSLGGSVGAAEPTAWGPLRVWRQGEQARFEVRLDVAGRARADIERLVGRVEPAVQAGVAAATGAWVEASVSGWSYPPEGDELGGVGTALALRWNLAGSLTAGPESAARGRAALEAVLAGSDPRLGELYEVFLLGVRAVQSIAPVVGLWAFTTVLEEEAPRGQHNLKHVPALADELRAEGYQLPDAPERNLDRVRAAALHPTPKDPAPSHEEVEYLRELARAYLLRRASRAREG